MFVVPGDEPIDDYPKWDYQEYPKTLPRDDFWGQGRRTIMGRRINEKEVSLLVDHIREQLGLEPSDVLLDIGCGNGALSARLFDDCGGYAGVDLSTYLIGVAQEFFERPPHYLFFSSDAIEFAGSVDRPSIFTKCLCFAVLQYLAPERVTEVLGSSGTGSRTCIAWCLETSRTARKRTCSLATATTRATCRDISLKSANGGRQRKSAVSRRVLAGRSASRRCPTISLTQSTVSMPS
jgi:SAM-dependent methyltransferase